MRISSQVFHACFVKDKLNPCTLTNILDELSQVGWLFFGRFVYKAINQVSFDVAIVFQRTTVSNTRIYMRVFLCSTVICSSVNNRIHIEDTFALTILPECTLVCKLLCRNNDCLLECLLDITIQTSFVNVLNVDFECRSISLGRLIVSQCTNSLRVHSPN